MLLDFIFRLNGRIITLEVVPWDTISSVKSTISVAEDIDRARVRLELVWAGMVMEDDTSTLASWGLQLPEPSYRRSIYVVLISKRRRVAAAARRR